jgi:hypothetical protein
MVFSGKEKQRRKVEINSLCSAEERKGIPLHTEPLEGLS